jgi:hypothetical protein
MIMYQFSFPFTIYHTNNLNTNAAGCEVCIKGIRKGLYVNPHTTPLTGPKIHFLGIVGVIPQIVCKGVKRGLKSNIVYNIVTFPSNCRCF